jgi:hypothetical protein
MDMARCLANSPSLPPSLSLALITSILLLVVERQRKRGFGG